MNKKKSIRSRGKLQLKRYFQNLENGDFVTIIREPAVQSNFPVKLQGRSGVIKDKRGKAYIIKIKDQSKEKLFLVEPIHLKKINILKNNDKR